MRCHFGKCSYFVLITEVLGCGCYFSDENMVNPIYYTIKSRAIVTQRLIDFVNRTITGTIK